MRTPGSLVAAERIAVERVDITDDASVDAFVARLEGRFDLVFVKAGVMGPAHQSAQATTPAEFGDLVYTNAIAPIRLARKLIDRIEPARGVLAFMSSLLGSVGANTTGGTELYRASKAALNSLTRSLAAELNGGRITVLDISPGWVRTDMGGPGAPLDVATSIRGVVTAIEARRGSGGCAFVNQNGGENPW